MAEAGSLDHVIYFDVVFYWERDFTTDVLFIFSEDVADVEISEAVEFSELGFKIVCCEAWEYVLSVGLLTRNIFELA